MSWVEREFFQKNSVYKVKKNIKEVLKYSSTFIPGEEFMFFEYSMDKDYSNYIYIFEDVNGAVRRVVENPGEPPFSSYEDYFTKIS